MISYDNEPKIFHLDTPHTSYCMALIDGRYLSHLYYGERIGRSDLTYLLRLHDYILPPSERPDEMATFWDRLPHEYPTEGRGDFRETCLGARNAGGLLSLEPVLTDWNIHREKKTIPGLP